MITKTIISCLLEVQNWQCFYCRCEINAYRFRRGAEFGNERGWTRDHVIPLSRGGGSFKNIVLSCGPCNQRKGCRMPNPYTIGRANYVWIAAAAMLDVPVDTPPPYRFEPSPALAEKMAFLLDNARLWAKTANPPKEKAARA